MPRRPEDTPGTALALPEDVRADLLAAQREQISTPQRLSQIKVMPAGAGMYEFMDNNETTREFDGIVLGSHARNVLWERPYGSDRPTGQDESQNGPGCSSADGKYGTPRPGFAHASLNGDVATGNERIECATCPYNQFDSKHMVGGNGRGKAVTNQRSIYVMLSGRSAPMELVLTNTSIPPFDEYLSTLLQREIPVQAVLTRFTQSIKTKPNSTIRYAIASFANAGALTQEVFANVLAMRAEYLRFIRPQDTVAAEAVEVEIEEEAAHRTPTEDDLPF